MCIVRAGPRLQAFEGRDGVQTAIVVVRRASAPYTDDVVYGIGLHTPTRTRKLLLIYISKFKFVLRIFFSF